jgi:pimeloyl-ACP methyl ester carboxylesterase
MLEMNGYEVDAYQDPLLALSREDNPNWSGACDELAKLAKPTLVITGTDDNKHQPYVNSLKIAGKILGAWLVQIKDAGHAVIDQYPDEISKILNIN